MKILQLMDEPWDSGLTANALNLSRLLSRRAECWVLCPEKSHAAKEAERLGLKAFLWKGSAWLQFPKIRRWAVSRKFDLLHAHTGSMHSLAALLKRSLPGSRLGRTRADAKKISRGFLHGYLARQTDFFIFPTERMRENFLMAHNYPIGRVRRIGMALSGEWQGEQAPSKSNGPLTVMMVGRLDPVKGHQDVIRAAQLVGLEELRYEFAGAEKNVKTQDLLALARKLGLERRVHFRGFMPQEALSQAMRKADIAVIASRSSEEVSRVCLEWMSLGKPIAATRVGQIVDLLDHGVSGLVVHPGKYEELAYALKRLAKEPDLRRSLGENARKKYEAKWSPEAVLEAHWTLYREVTGAQHG